MSDESLDTLVSLNTVKNVSIDSLVELIYTGKYNSFFKKDPILKKMLPTSEKVIDNDSISKKLEQELIKNILPNTFPHVISQSIKLKLIPLKFQKLK